MKCKRAGSGKASCFTATKRIKEENQKRIQKRKVTKEKESKAAGGAGGGGDEAELASNGQVLGDKRDGGSSGSGSDNLAAAGGASLVCPSNWKGMSRHQRKRRRHARAHLQSKED